MTYFNHMRMESDSSSFDERIFEALLGHSVEDESFLTRPGKGYSKRSSHIQQLRNLCRQASEVAFDELSAPSRKALAASERFLNELPEGCLELKLAVSHSGEINFFFGDDAHPFQALIDDTGLVSFYGEVNGEEIRGSDIAPADFPGLKLLKFLDQKK